MYVVFILKHMCKRKKPAYGLHMIDLYMYEGKESFLAQKKKKEVF